MVVTSWSRRTLEQKAEAFSGRQRDGGGEEVAQGCGELVLKAPYFAYHTEYYPFNSSPPKP